MDCDTIDGLSEADIEMLYDDITNNGDSIAAIVYFECNIYTAYGVETCCTCNRCGGGCYGVRCGCTRYGYGRWHCSSSGNIPYGVWRWTGNR